MTKKELKQYLNLRGESRDIEERITRLEHEISELEAGAIESDVVACGRRGRKALGTVKITGFPESKYQAKKTRLLSCKLRNAELKVLIDDQIHRVDEYICTIEDTEVRRILRFRCLEDKVLSWQQVANRMNRDGGAYTADSCRMIVSRYLKAK